MALLLILVSVSMVIVPPTQGSEVSPLGLAVKFKDITVYKGAETNEVGIYFKQSFQFSDYAAVLRETEEEITKLENIPALSKTANSPQFRSIGHILGDLKRTFLGIKKSLETLDTYRNTSSSKTYQTHCLVEYREITKTQLEEALKEIVTHVNGIDYQGTSTTFTDAEKYYNLVNGLTNFREILTDFCQLVTDRLTILDTFSIGQLADEVPAVIQTQTCASVGTPEEFKVISCDKLAQGFYCNIEVITYTEPQYLALYTKVNFQGIELMGETEGQLLARDSSLNWKLLTCQDDFNNDNLPDYFKLCSITDYNNGCSRSLDLRRAALLIKNCNFTRRTPDAVTMTETGTLIMGNKAVIKLLQSDGTVFKVLDQELPLLITTSRTIELEMGGIKTKIKPQKPTQHETVAEFFLDDQDIKTIKQSLNIDDFTDNLGLDDYIDLILVIIVTIVVPIVGVLCKKHIQTSDYWIKKEVQIAKIEKPENKSKRNLKENHVVFSMSRT